MNDKIEWPKVTVYEPEVTTYYPNTVISYTTVYNIAGITEDHPCQEQLLPLITRDREDMIRQMNEYITNKISLVCSMHISGDIN